uniref:Uncharacterized protein LOC104245242 n=1 Tax=Nicotiana sylvestris TaxID=4096 RepID=A0A1U7YAZ9_NICSY|nr:PREDICTED: uncharacterized protein LOC104245242 [Nicotiana sylvestris]
MQKYCISCYCVCIRLFITFIPSEFSKRGPFTLLSF